MWKYPLYRPKKNYITFGLVSYFIAILASCAVSVDFNLSFWGDAERMLGFFHLSHFLIFYLILVTVFREWREWKILFLASIGIATIVSLIGLLGENTYTVIGNVAYVAGYLIFNIYFSLILFFREKGSVKWLYVIPILIMLLEFGAANISGALIGLVVSVFILFFIIGVFHRRNVIRKGVWALLVIFLLLVVFIFSQRNSDWFQGNRMLRDISFEQNTFQTRLISWNSAWMDFGHHPIFGTGFGNYAITFDRYFDSKFLDHGRTGTYFDRAHNNLIDITSTTGLVGLLTYLSIFIATLYYLWIRFRENGKIIGLEGDSLKNLEIGLIVALISAYFIQNLAVFDSLTTYMGLMVVLAFVGHVGLNKGGEENVNEEEALKNFGQEILAIVMIFLVIFFVAIRPNIQSVRLFKNIISGYGQMMQGELEPGLEKVKEILDKDYALSRDARVVIINFTTANPHIFSFISSNDSAKEWGDYLVEMAEKNVEYNPDDNLMQMQLAQISDVVSRSQPEDLQYFNYHSAKAVQAIERSIESSPGRLPVYLVKGQLLFARGETEKGVRAIEEAKKLNPRFPDSYCRLGQIYLLMGENESEMRKNLDACVELGGVDQIKSDRLLKDAIVYYANQGEIEKAILLAERLVLLHDDNPEYWFNLTKLYIINNSKFKAETAAQNTINLDEKLEEAIEGLFRDRGW